MINLAWILIVIVAILGRHYLIEDNQDRFIWFVIRATIVTEFMLWYVHLGYAWYWAAFYMVGTFWFPYYVALNRLRGRRIDYLMPKDSLVNWILLKVLRTESIVFYVSLWLLILAVSLMLHYGL